jgi:hypothetical protein
VPRFIGSARLGLGLLLVLTLLAGLGGCARDGTPASSPSSQGPTALADAGPALYGVGVACGGNPAATATCAAATGTPTVCPPVQGVQSCQPAASIFAIGERSGIVRWRHAEPTVGYSSQVVLLPAADTLYAFVGAPDGSGPGDLTARRASDGTALWQRHLPTFASQMFLADNTLLVFTFTPRDGTTDVWVTG